MTKTIDTLVDDIYGLFTGDKFEVTARHLEQFGGELTRLVGSRFADERGDGSLRLSNIGKPDRQLWYELNYKGPVEEMSPHAYIKFMYGDIIEHMVLLFAREAGHTVEMEQVEVELEGIKGHPDAVIDGVVVDVKSASPYSFKKFEDGSLLEEGNDPFGYVGQLASYVEAINPDADGAFLAVEKVLGKLCLLRVPNEVLKQYQVKNRIDHAKKMVASPDVPPRCYEPKAEGKSGNFVLSVGCSYCKHKFHCWSDANGGTGLRTFAYANGPKFFTHIEREPKVLEERGDF